MTKRELRQRVRHILEHGIRRTTIRTIGPKPEDNRPASVFYELPDGFIVTEAELEQMKLDLVPEPSSGPPQVASWPDIFQAVRAWAATRVPSHMPLRQRIVGQIKTELKRRNESAAPRTIQRKATELTNLIDCGN
jgi:hypothetical protein